MLLHFIFQFYKLRNKIRVYWCIVLSELRNANGPVLLPEFPDCAITSPVLHFWLAFTLILERCYKVLLKPLP